MCIVIVNTGIQHLNVYESLILSHGQGLAYSK